MTEPPPACRVLAAELQALRARAGLSLAGLAAATAYSKSSWDRCLKARALPPWPAVRALCRAADEPEQRVRALWELAETAWSRRERVHSPVPAPERVTSEPPPTDLSHTRVQDTTDAGPARPSAPEAAPDPATGDAVTDAPTTLLLHTGVHLAEAAAEASAGDDPPNLPPHNAVPPAGPPTPADPPPSASASARPRPRRRPAPLTLALAAAAVVALLAGVLVLRAVTGGGGAPDASRTVSPSGALHCTGHACVGLDPSATVCGQQPETRLQQRTGSGATLQVRFAPTCGTVWGRLWGAQPGDRLTLSAPDERQQGVDITPANAEQFVLTPMLLAPRHGTAVRACLLLTGGRAPECYAAEGP